MSAASNAWDLYDMLKDALHDFNDPENIPLVVQFEAGDDAVYNVEAVLADLGEGPVLRIKSIGKK